MGATLATVNAITKEVYGPRVVDQLENSNVLTKRIEKTSQGTSSEAGGKYVTFPLHVRRNHGIGYRNELEQLQNPGQQGYQSVRVPLRYGYGRVHLSGQTIELVNENYQAFASAMTEEMDGLKTDISKDTNRILFGDGSGTIAVLDAVAGVNDIPVTSGYKFLELGMVVDIMDASALPATVAVSRTITAMDDGTETITVDGAAVTTTAGDFLVRTGNYNKEPQGLSSLVNNDPAKAIFNLTPTDEPKWQSVVDNSGGALSESKMIAMCDALRQNGGAPTVIMADLGTRRAYFNLLTTQRRQTDTKTFDGGFKGLTFSYEDDIPVVTDVDCTDQTMYFLREKDYKIYRRNPWAWDDRDGSVWKWVTNYDAYEALMKQYWEFATQRRNTQGRMTGITAG